MLREVLTMTDKFNRYIVECKYMFTETDIALKTDLIDT